MRQMQDSAESIRDCEHVAETGMKELYQTYPEARPTGFLFITMLFLITAALSVAVLDDGNLAIFTLDAYVVLMAWYVLIMRQKCYRFIEKLDRYRKKTADLTAQFRMDG